LLKISQCSYHFCTTRDLLLIKDTAVEIAEGSNFGRNLNKK